MNRHIPPRTSSPMHEPSRLELVAILLALLLLYGIVGRMDYEDAVALACVQGGSQTDDCPVHADAAADTADDTADQTASAVDPGHWQALRY